MEIESRKLLSVTVSTAIGLMLGYFLFDDSEAVDRLSMEIARLRDSAVAHDSNKVFPRPRFPERSQPGWSGSPQAASDVSGRFEHTMTDEGRAKLSDLLKRQQTGEYFLKDAFPPEQAAIAWFRRSSYKNSVDQEGPRYRAILAELGVDATEREQIVDHIGKIAEADTKSVLAVTQLLEARRDLEKRLEQISPEAVSSLNESEAFRRATLEYEGHHPAQPGLGEYLQERLGQPIELADQGTILRMIQETGAITTEYSTGPFDDVLLPAMGEPMVAERLQDGAARIGAVAERLKETMRESELPREHQEAINEYYASKVHEKQAMAAHMLMGTLPSIVPTPMPPPDTQP